jgi:hypothetical protein
MDMGLVSTLRLPYSYSSPSSLFTVGADGSTYIYHARIDWLDSRQIKEIEGRLSKLEEKL